MAVLLAEHRLERCLAAADRVLALDSGSLAFDGAALDFLAWALRADPALATPGARLLEGASGYRPRRASGRRVEACPRGASSSPHPSGRRRSPATGARRVLGIGRRRSDEDAPAVRVRICGSSWGGRRADRGAARGGARDRGGGARRPDGAERRREEHPPARRGRARSARSRANRDSPRGRPPAPAAGRPVPARAGRRRAARAPRAAGASPLRPRGSDRRRPARPLRGERQRLALAIVVAGRGPDEGESPGLFCSTSRPEGWTEPASSSWPRSPAGSPTRERGGDRDP